MKKLKIVMVMLLICSISVSVVSASGGRDIAPADEAIPEGKEAIGAGGTFKYLDLSKANWDDSSSVKITGFYEAPELKAKVTTGAILPLDERLPEEPLVVKPVEEIGKYGGIWQAAAVGENGISLWQYQLYEPLVRYSRDLARIVPNIAKGWEWGEENKSLTFFLRKGMRWSDGELFTADDFLFYWEDILLNDELSTAKPAILKINGELGKFEKIDDYTIKYSFSSPYGALLGTLANLLGKPQMYQPKHYLEQFHPKYTPMDDIEKKMKEEGFDTWTDLFSRKSAMLTNPDIPTIFAWVQENTVDQPVFTFKRNPYYWKVDIKGNQLPYIGRIEHVQISNEEALLLKEIAGEVTFQMPYIARTIENYTVLMQNREKGDYRLIPLTASVWNATLHFNLWAEDPVLKELFNNRQFRIALSVGMNRKEMNQIEYQGLGFEGHQAPNESSVWYEEKSAKAYTEYDPDKANKMLDEIGLSKRDSEGYRLRSDGKRLGIILTIQYGPQVAEIIKKNWNDLGIDVVVKPLDKRAYRGGIREMKHQVSMGAGQIGVPGTPFPEPVFTYPISSSFYTAPNWGIWYATDGKEGEEPPADAKRLLEILNDLYSESDDEKRIELIKEAMSIHAENLWRVGVLTSPTKVYNAIVKNDIGNVAEYMYMHTGGFATFQAFFK